MYSQHPHHPLRPQQQQQQPQASYPNVMDSYNPSYTSNVVRHQLPPPPPPHHLVIPPEPTPNESTTLPLSIPELADFASMMIYLMWHARRPSVMALHDLSKAINYTQQTGDHQLGHSKETATIASRTSAAFKKFCKQVNINKLYLNVCMCDWQVQSRSWQLHNFQNLWFCYHWNILPCYCKSTQIYKVQKDQNIDYSQ